MVKRKLVKGLMVDEIHKYPDWAVDIKAIYDSFPKLNVLFSGSSLLQISKQKADLSRRAIIFNLHGLSFRLSLLIIHLHFLSLLLFIVVQLTLSKSA